MNQQSFPGGAIPPFTMPPGIPGIPGGIPPHSIGATPLIAAAYINQMAGQQNAVGASQKEDRGEEDHGGASPMVRPQSRSRGDKRAEHKRSRDEDSDGEGSDGELVVDEVGGSLKLVYDN